MDGHDDNDKMEGITGNTLVNYPMEELIYNKVQFGFFFFSF